MLAAHTADRERWANAASARCFSQLERQKCELLRAFEDWDPEWLSYKPGPENWSVLQVLDHLARTEAGVRAISERTLAQPRTKPSFTERRRLQTFLLMLRSPVRIQVPQAVQHVLPGSPSCLEEIAARWKDERSQLRALLLPIGGDALRSIAMRHPAVGAISLRGALQFLLIHTFHHRFQLDRLRRAIAEARL